MVAEKSSFQFLLSGFDVLRNVGEYFEKCLTNLTGGSKVFDLLLVEPLRAKKVAFCPKIYETSDGSLVILKLKVESHIAPKNRRQPHKFICFNASGYVNLVFFKIYPSQIEKLKIGEEVAVLGVLQNSGGERQIVHPDFVERSEKIDNLPKIDLTYPLSGKLTQKFVRSKINEVLRFLNKNYDEEKAKNNDWVDKNLVKERCFPAFFDALKMIHNYGFEYDEDKILKARERLKYDEFLAWQIAMNFVRKQEEKKKEKPEIAKNLAQDFMKNMPFEPTNAQKNAIKEIEQNILSEKTMLRLLQGDVGSGKTLVAIYACLLAVSCKKQACVIVPIAILANQHFEYFKKLLQDFDVNIEILTGKIRKKKRDQILQDLKAGEIDILIATHAVLVDDVEFKNLSLAIIDEQHRFGVMQRLKLVEKGKDMDVLLMSATPIPRSLMMGLYGDMDISVLDEKPKNRQEIETLVMSEKKSSSIYDSVKRSMKKGEKIYWICPLIAKKDEEELAQEKEDLGLVVAEEKFEELQKVFGKEKVALIHGKMKESQKDKIMDEFKNGQDLQILVATTVIEVGVDVSDATVIVIENSENFGLSQLHQLRGRVGRGEKKSYCILLYGKRFGQKAKERLEIMRNSNDGFHIAEEDLRLRGSGEMIGTKQSGELGFKIANLEIDVDLLKIACKNAQVILNEDENLSQKKSLKYHALLKLFSYDDCLRIVSGG